MDLIFLKYVKEKKEKLNNAEKFLKERLSKIKEILPDSEIYIFGSVAENNYDILSDIDVAIVSDSINNSLEIIKKIQEILGTPFEIHLFTREEWENYKKYIKYKKIF